MQTEKRYRNKVYTQKLLLHCPLDLSDKKEIILIMYNLLGTLYEPSKKQDYKILFVQKIHVK